MASLSRLGSDSVSGDDDCLEKVSDSGMKTSNPPPWPWVLTYFGVILDAGVLGF